VIICPKELTQLDQVLSTGDPNIDSEDGHPIAYTSILQAAQSYEKKPLFLREDHEQITSDPIKSVEVSKWMNTAAKVATGSRRRVLENGPDVMNSEDEDAVKDDHGDELTGVYAPRCASLDQARLTAEQAAAQRASSFEAAPREPPRSRSPAYHSSDDDDLSRPEWVWSQRLGHVRKNKAWVKRLAESAMALPAPKPQKALPAPESERQPTPESFDMEDQGEMTDDQKRCARIGKKKATATRKASAVQPVPEAKASKPVTGQESPETKVSKPMRTRRQAKEASGAGSLRGVVGSGSTGYVCDKSSPSSKPGS
jgi:hypothetical protein